MVFEDLVRDQEVDGSNPFAPTISFRTSNLRTDLISARVSDRYSAPVMSHTRKSKIHMDANGVYQDLKLFRASLLTLMNPQLL